jgi:uncharacterized protein (TIGR01319 family)
VKRRCVVVGDIGSTFTKVGVIEVSSATLLARAAVGTDHSDLAGGVEAAIAQALPQGAAVEETLLCSSAAGGLRVAVIGLEPRLTVEAGRRAAATAGARIVASLAGVLDQHLTGELAAARPDVVLLVGGTNGGDRAAIVENARMLATCTDFVQAIVVAGNEEAQPAIVRELGAVAVVRLAPNVLPSVGVLAIEGAQREIRELFAEHVIGRGRFASTSPIAAAVQMPTPSAVLGGTRILARLAHLDVHLARPVLVDIGGATTDVHSMLPIDPHAAAYGRAVVPDQEATRTVEADLGVRENAAALVEEVCRSGYIGEDEARILGEPAERRVRERDFIAEDAVEVEHDSRLATLAAALAIARHAGALRVVLSESGATLRRTGRDLRCATCLIGSGGIFEAAADATALLDRSLRLAREHHALVPEELPTRLDSSHVAVAAGLLAVRRPALAEALLAREVATGGLACVA